MDPLLPTLAERLAVARASMRIGLPVAIGGFMVAAVETLSPARLAALRALGSVTLALTARRAGTLKIVPYDGDLARVALPVEADTAWLRAMADPARDLDTPLKAGLRAERGEAPEVPAARAALALAKAAQLLPAAVLVAASGPDPLPPDAALAQLAAEATLLPVAAAALPLTASPAARLHVFRPDDGGEEHYAIEIGSPDRSAPVLVRLHSACFTGDVLGSLKCDCGPQLHAALAAMGAAGSGVLLYLNQEGRGIGLANKMRAYALQGQGFDTVEANHRLGFEDDERDFRLGAALLARLGIGQVRLLTNNPRKVAMLERQGIRVAERVPLLTERNAYNTGYLDTKAAKSGHLL